MSNQINSNLNIGSVENALKHIVKYLVIKKLSGDDTYIEAMKMYFLNNLSPSDIAVALGESKNVAHSVRNRVYEILNKFNAPKSPTFVRELVRIALRCIEWLEPILVRERGLYRCKVCGAWISMDRYSRTRHVAYKHANLVNRLTRTALSKAKNLVSNHEDI